MKIVCVYHSVDLDGFMSAAIIKHYYLLENNSIAASGDDINNVDFIGYNYGQSIPDLSEYDQVIMCDISFPKEEMFNLISKTDLTWIDHHISAIKDIESGFSIPEEQLSGVRKIDFAACELTWKYFFPNETMPEIVRLLGRYDCFGHKNTSEEQTVLEFQYGARACISNYDEAYKHLIDCINHPNLKVEDMVHLTGIAIYNYLCQEAKQIYNTRFDLMFDSRLSNTPFRFAAINRSRFNPINFGIDYHIDGYDGVACFWYEDNKLCFSLYNDNGLVDCSTIAKRYGGGGHKGAAGFVFKCELQYSNMTVFDLIEKLGKATI